MSKRRLPGVHSLVFAFVLVALSSANPTSAQEIALSLGSFEFIENANQSGEFGLEYRFSQRRLELFSVELDVIPFLAGSRTGDDSTWWIAGGRVEDRFARRGFVALSFGLSYYDQGDGPDLGGSFHFRSMGEIGFHLDDRSRLALGIHHLSNAGIRNRNPGSESLVVLYSVALD